ncbi:MAG: hypothetical protein Q4G59_08020, partial [Planctomycetia bacterium]|nr:hypothetical protein [Planctomycetia bacterium]
DDDDIYLPHWLEAHAKNFDQGAVWSYAKELYWSERNNILYKWVYPGKGWIMHPGHAFLKKVFWQAGGYPHLAWKEDAGLFLAFYDMGLQPVDAVKDYDVSYLIYRQKLDADHRPTGGMPLEEYQKDIGGPQLPKAALAIGWKKKYSDLVHTFEKNRIVSKSTF